MDKKEKKNNYLKYIVSELLLLLTAFISCVLQELFAGEFYYIKPIYFLIDIVIIFIVSSFIMLFVNNYMITSIIILFLSSLIGIIEYFVMDFRGTPLMLSDFIVARTALSVVGSYNIVFPREYTIYFIIFVLTIILLVILYRSIIRNKLKWYYRWVNLTLFLVFITIFQIFLRPLLSNNTWAVTEIFHDQGINSSLISYSVFINKKPKGYSEKRCVSILDDCQTIEGNTTKAKNIIVIMNESFSDLRIYDDNDYLNEYMQGIDSINDNVVKGNLYVPVYGGGTSETEFEVLTGISTRYITGVPYVTAINRNMDSICRVLEKKDYTNIAFHPYAATNWNRNNAYPLIGFSNFYSDVDLTEDIDMSFSNWGLNDSSDYNEIIKIDKEINEPLFLFNVTMQNHGGYLSPSNNEILVDNPELKDYPAARTYLSLIKLSNEAITDLIDYYKEQDEPTLICFFGDHQATIETEYYEKLLKRSLSDMSNEEGIISYITPFFIWANYDIEDKYVDKISANYLEDLILLNAGIDLTGYESFTYKLFEKYPVITRYGIIDKEGTFYMDDGIINDSLLTDYSYLQYYRLNHTNNGE